MSNEQLMPFRRKIIREEGTIKLSFFKVFVKPNENVET